MQLCVYLSRFVGLGEVDVSVKEFVCLREEKKSVPALMKECGFLCVHVVLV